PAKRIDRLVARFRRRLTRTGQLRKLARELYDLLLRPVEPHLRGRRNLFLSPDGDLNLVPFGALMDGQGRYLLQRYGLTYLTSGRDLLHLSAAPAKRTGQTVVLAAPAFGGGDNAGDAPGPSPRTRGRRAFGMEKMTWDPLPGTEQEARNIKRVFPEARLLVGKLASESAVKKLAAPRLLHLATHGFFLPDRGDPAAHRLASIENPLLRSGLALAGANRRQAGDEDGLLTALEAAQLDLWGNRLVVLSACETGLGEASVGEGVYGLRRALVIAGARSLLMSLWRVDDEATRDLMDAFYRRLRSGKGLSEALRQSQLEMIENENRAHPFFWAAFILSGDWRPL
ncbi:MAG: CHAT domain-containing protein, partial [Anaerolineales bacterium]